MFRDSAGKGSHASALLLSELRHGLEAFFVSPSGLRSELLTNSLLRAGEIEGALADCGNPHVLLASALSDALARALVHNESEPVRGALHALLTCALPKSLDLTTPEGFAYYALDPRQYAALICKLARGGPAAVIGIRSIGTVLSAISAAALGCERMTVRPGGHPYNRELIFSAEQQQWVCRNSSANSQFFIVDEGPGLSGSSFLATAEALEECGVSREKITLVGSNPCDPAGLVAKDAAARWERFRSHVVEPLPLPSNTRPFRDWDWRVELLTDASAWPPMWAQLTSPKYLSQDRRTLWKFEGLGRSGDAVRSRAQLLGCAGVSPHTLGTSQGLTAYDFDPVAFQGGAAELNREWLENIAHYCVLRRSELKASVTSTLELAAMTRHNVSNLLGQDLADTFELPLEHPAICDARMMPYEWIRTAEGKILKTDSVAHGDNHFFPGPCDIAWDLAGAMIEWQMDESAAKEFLRLYEQQSNDRVFSRLVPYRVAYAAFQAAYARMAATALAGSAEAERFDRDLERYLGVLRKEADPILRPKSLSLSV